MRLKIILIVLMALMFLTANTVTGVFHESVLTKETKLVYDGESPQKTRATDGDSTLNQKELNKTSDFSNAKTEENVARSWSPNIFPFDSFVKDISTHKTDMWRDLAKVDGDSAELVVGLNNAQPDSCVKISDLIVENGGKLVNTVSTEDEVIAVVADLPLDLVSSFTEDVQASNLARYIEPNMKYQTQLVPNDPYWTLQWGPQKIEADYAWNTTIGDSSVLVAVIDTGIDYDHPDLVANYVPLGYDWVNGDSDPMDDEGHGTHCAGIIAAELNNGIGIAGVAQVSIMAEKGLNQYGSGYEDDLAHAIVDAVDRGADILSNSWGGYSESQLIYDAVKYAYDNGVLVVAAAGNEAWNNKLYPAAYDEVIAVTATDANDDPAIFTNFGEWVEVAAPGVEIYSTVWNDWYTWKSGTSMACPHVSGVAGLIWSQFPNMTRDWVRAQLRYTADDLGEPGFDEYYGFGRINARKAVEQAPQDHDLLIFNWKKPRSIQPGDHVSLNATVLNFGANDENDVTVQLLVDRNLTDSTLISYLTNGTSTTVSLSWNPLAERTYNVTLYIVPVLGETVIENNVVSAMVWVRYARFVLWDDVHDGDGDSLTGNYLSLYELLISNGFVVDELINGTINSVLLASYDILVLIDPEYDFLSSEITDIHNWVATGGALIIIPDAGYPPTLAQIMAPYNVQLTGLDTYYGTTTNIILHPITWGVGSIYYDRAWELDITSPCEALAWSLENYAFLSVTGNEVVVLSDSNIMDNYGLGMADNTQLMLNIFNWVGVKYEHELTVYLEAPSYLMPGESSQLNATVHNRGLNNETNVELQLLINGTIENEVTIPKLVNGTSYTIDYEWTPTTEATYNVTVYAPPVAQENLTINNVATKFVPVTYPLIRPIEGQWANYIMNYYDASGQIIGTGYWNFTYDHYVEPHLIYIIWSLRDPSGYIVTNWMIVNIMNRMVESGIWAGMWYPGWIETDITIGSTINLMEGPATVNGSKIIPIGMYPVDCWELPVWVYEYSYAFCYDKTSGLWISMEFIDPYYKERSELLLMDTNIPIGTTYQHELAATLEAPHFLEPGNSSLLNATVYNIGLSKETDVELQLLINGAQVDSVTIPELPNSTSYTISYHWTPLVEATYNITAYAPPVLGENITINNAVTQLVKVITVKGYVLFDQTHRTDNIYYYNIWVTDLIDRGYIIDTLTISPITQPMLEDYDVFVIPQAYDYYSSDELLAIQNFVLDGGGLLVIGDDRPYIYTELTSFAGITWGIGGYAGYAKDITSHPITKGVTTTYFPAPASEMYVTSPAQDIIRDDYGNVMLAVSEVGLGAVIGIADEDSIGDYYIGYAGNQRLANNMIDWLKSRHPFASFTHSPLDPYIGETVTFDASASYDPDGIIVSYIWDFGDDSSGEGNITTHLYADGGTYTVTLTVIDNENLNSISTTEITVSRTTLEIETEVGSAHFRGEIAEFYILVSGLGKPVDANINATLYYNGNIHEYLSTSVENIDLGFYRIPYTIPIDASPGTYALLVEARYLSLEGVSLKSFLLSPTLTEWNAWLIDIQGDIATIKTDIGTIKVSLEDINLRLEDIEERLPFQKTIVATIDTEIGVIWVDLADINAVLTSIDGRIATVDTDIGLMQVDISKINAELITLSGTTATIKSDLGTITTDIANIRLKVTEISEDTATIETTFGTFTGEVTSIEKDIATIETDFGTVKVNIGTIEETPSTYAVPLNLVLLSWIIIAAGAILLAVFLRRKRS